jgi:hypothetical protein
MNKSTIDNKNDPILQPINEQLSDSFQGKDSPMEDDHPEAQPLLVFASYPVILILGLIIALIAWSLTSG